ncbi:MAG: hypothetical protein J6A01_00710 [Proteobacteria bacterium]|nr:hypothetical protein [Pseudomonadota bacterium]
MGTVKRFFNALGTQISDRMSHQNAETDDYYITLYDYEEQKEQIYELIKESIARNDPAIAQDVIVKYREVAEYDQTFINLINQWKCVFPIQSSTYAVTQTAETALANSVHSNSLQASPDNVFKIIALKKQFEQNKGQILNDLFDSFQNNNFHKAAGIIEKYFPVARKDADFFDVIKYIEHELKCKNIKQLETVLNTVPENDVASRMPIIHSILKIDQNADNYKSELLRCEKMMGMHDSNSNFDDQMDVDGVTANQLPTTMPFKKNALIEIKDESVLSRIKDLIPKIAKSNKSPSNPPNPFTKGQHQLCLVKSKDALAEVKGKPGVLRGFSKDAQGKINGHAEIVPVDPRTIAANTGSLAIVNSAMIAMSVGMVAIVVVGAYFMNKISHQISDISYQIIRHLFSDS